MGQQQKNGKIKHIFGLRSNMTRQNNESREKSGIK